MARRFNRLRRGVVGFGVLAALTGAASASAATTRQAELSGQAEVLREINLARVTRGIPPLRISKILNVPARFHGTYLARTGILDHDGQDGRPFYVRLYAAGFSRRKAVGENLGLIGGCSPDAADVMVDMWLSSPGHRANLLSPRFKVVGISVVQAADCEQTIYTTDFGA